MCLTEFGPRDILVWRTDYMDDATGQRTGFKTRYVELDLGYTHWMGDVIELRPEIRWEHPREAQAYDNPTAAPEGGKRSQAMIRVWRAQRLWHTAWLSDERVGGGCRSSTGSRL
ncbi:MAG: hypothetical protein WA807_05710 [Steroidobacteraceae bacterium]